MIHRLDPSARKPPPTYIVPSQAMVTDMYALRCIAVRGEILKFIGETRIGT